MRHRQTRGRGESGQVLVLGALSILAVALLVFITLNLGQAVFEKIRIQQLADTAAFSNATQQARAFNFFAYTNRANISGLVAASTVHAYMSVASSVPGLFLSASNNYLSLSAIEFGVCLARMAVLDFSALVHCGHGALHITSAIRSRKMWKEYLNKFKKAYEQTQPSPFDAAMLALDTHMFLIASSQAALRIGLMAQLGMDTITRELRDKFAPQASSNPALVIAHNVRDFAKAIDADPELVRWEATEIANGSRYSTGTLNQEFLSKRSGTDMMSLTSAKAILDLFNEIGRSSQGHTSIIPLVGEGQSRVIRDFPKPISRIQHSNAGPSGNSVASFDDPWVFTTAIQLCTFSAASIPMSTKSWISSGPERGEHRISNTWCDRSQAHKLRCLSANLGANDIPGFSQLPAVGALPGFSCFTLFKANPKPEENFGQPVVYLFIAQDLRLLMGGKRGPWEITQSGSVNINLRGQSGAGGGANTVTLADDPAKFGRGLAMSKALVYYHLPSRNEGWKEHPNFFNPYWKAKLQPFRGSREVEWVLAASGMPFDFLSAVALGAPLP